MRRMDLFSTGELHQLLKTERHLDANKIVNFRIDYSIRAKKNRSSIHIVGQKENLPIGAPYKNLTIYLTQRSSRGPDISESKSSKEQIFPPESTQKASYIEGFCY